MKEETSKGWIVITSILKTLMTLFLIGIIMYLLTLGGVEVYQHNSYDRFQDGVFSYIEKLDPLYGSIGLLIFIFINCISFAIFNFFIKKFKNYNKIIGIILYLIFAFVFNYVMLIYYWSLFGYYEFENKLLNFFNLVIVREGFIIFPITYIELYLLKELKKEVKK